MESQSSSHTTRRVKPSVGTRRAAAQFLGGSTHRTPDAVVKALVALQAQDPLGVRWAIGVRLPGSREAEIVRSLDQGRLVRTHLFRCTWQVLTPDDLAWLLPHFGPRVIRSIQGRLKQLQLTADVLRRSETVLQRALERAPEGLGREGLAEVLTRAKVDSSEQRLSHLLTHAELNGLLVSGALADGKATWVLAESRLPKRRATSFDEMIHQLARRFIASRGPVSVDDFAWWSGVKRTEARAAFTEVDEAIERDGLWSVDGPDEDATHVLPPFDEFLISYARRDHVLDPSQVKRINAGGGLLAPIIVHRGQVIGTWTRTLERRKVEVLPVYFTSPSASLRRSVAEAFGHYARFLDRELLLAP